MSPVWCHPWRPASAVASGSPPVPGRALTPECSSDRRRRPRWGLGLTLLTLLALGRWGRRGADRIGAVPGLPDHQQRRRVAVIRRGGTACMVVGVAFVITAIAAAVS